MGQKKRNFVTERVFCIALKFRMNSSLIHTDMWRKFYRFEENSFRVTEIFSLGINEFIVLAVARQLI